MDDSAQERHEAADDEERLAVYGLSKLQRSNLILQEGECSTVTVRGGGAERYQKSARQVPVKTVDDLKRMIGVPDEVMRDRCRCPEQLTGSFPPGFAKIEDLSPWQRDILRSATDAYVHGDSRHVAHYAPAINKALGLVDKAKISIIGFADIVVERNAVLTISPSIDVLYANKVLVKAGGKIRFTSRLKIDCTSIEGQEGYVIFNPVDIGTTIATTLAQEGTP